ncbi:hypothetical protein [Paenibacillus uliginis]|uniref:hypothetical protein n=1 Tax=Paenibacillus uliginis TaxID=683737 RepID=UPI001AD8249E|nr:hypothetical protein [Paenibacillus uliginis]
MSASLLFAYPGDDPTEAMTGRTHPSGCTLYVRGCYIYAAKSELAHGAVQLDWWRHRLGDRRMAAK